MPGSGSATPVIAGDRIFVMADPYVLLCLDKTTGKIRWRKSNAIDEVIAPSGMDEYKERCAKWFDAYERKLECEIERVNIAQQLMALNADDPKLVEGRGELGKEIARLDKAMERLPQFALRSKKGGWRIGFTCSTPVTDGEVIFVLFGNGVGALYDLDGNLKWARFFRHRVRGYGQSTSPAMIGGVIAVHMDDEFFGVDAATGKTLWLEYELQHQGTPAGIRLGGHDFFITNDGNIRKAKDGSQVAKIGLMRFHTPIIEKDGTVWHVPNDSSLSAVRLLPDGQGGVKTQRVWGGPAPGQIYWSSPLIQKGQKGYGEAGRTFGGILAFMATDNRRHAYFDKIFAMVTALTRSRSIDRYLTRG